ncbi:GNAT family N-acetyltransferase [Streptomyces hoynatensis]|uniref:GNAT family N-acetyltransferase n=1 Tax=Streptomyces hoynatensis TaxID=1141874 RepID=A0A3A9Z2Q6_9ACTN|nr:GNAT family N-acetyltransferase [Streptomyces hoynatensis]RKN41647.1 GNAT family N-acetyltransferase [Streptomyces hoynatensis]
MTIRPARTEEAGPLSELALRSKGHWGYDAEFLESCRAELTLTAEDIARGGTAVAERDGTVLGFVTVVGPPPTGELAMLFVEPQAIGQGIGRALFTHAVAAAREAGFERLVFEADPHAEPFYRAMGSERVGLVPSGSIPGRFLPQMAFALTAAPLA